jgi:hypothetical protein
MIRHHDPRYRGVNPLDQNRHFDEREPRYVSSQEQGGTIGFFALVAFIAALALGVALFVSGPDETVRQAGEVNPPAVEQQSDDAGS